MPQQEVHPVIWHKLGPVEQAVLEDFASRLLMGQRAYGPLTLFKKDWEKESYEELLDNSVYMTVEVLRRRVCGSDLTKTSKRSFIGWAGALIWGTCRTLLAGLSTRLSRGQTPRLER